MMKPWIILLAAGASALLAGCTDNPRKEVSDEDVCAAYKAQLDKMLANPNMTDQDKRNMLPRLSGYGMCKDKVGTGGLSVNAGPGGGAPFNPAAEEARLRGKNSKR